MTNFSKPLIPPSLMHVLTAKNATKIRDKDNGGQWRSLSTDPVSIKGVIMPLSNKDLKYLPEGTFTQNSQKLYTNGDVVAVGSEITDIDGKTYTVKQELDHNSIHPMKRYLVEKAERSAQK
jgi:hypothetical protein